MCAGERGGEGGERGKRSERDAGVKISHVISYRSRFPRSAQQLIRRTHLNPTSTAPRNPPRPLPNSPSTGGGEPARDTAREPVLDPVRDTAREPIADAILELAREIARERISFFSLRMPFFSLRSFLVLHAEFLRRWLQRGSCRSGGGVEEKWRSGGGVEEVWRRCGGGVEEECYEGEQARQEE